MAYSADLEIVCGNDVIVPVQLYDGDTGTTPLDLTGVQELTYLVKRRLDPDSPALITKALSDAGTEIVISGPEAGGLVEITFLKEDTLPDSGPGERLVGYYEHEFLVTDVAGNVSTVFQGTLHIKATAL